MGMLKCTALLLSALFLVSSACVVVSAQTTVKVTFPTNNGQAGPTQTVIGNAASIPSGQNLWIVLYIPSVGRYYPQAPPVTVKSDGSWSARPSIGTGSDNGKTFEIMAVVTGANANSEFNNYIDTGKSTGSYPGLTSLPAGAQVMDSVSVTRVSENVPTPTGAASPTTSTPSASPIPSSNATITASSTVTVTTSATPSRGFLGLPGFEGVFALLAIAAAYVFVSWRHKR